MYVMTWPDVKPAFSSNPTLHIIFQLINSTSLKQWPWPMSTSSIKCDGPFRHNVTAVLCTETYYFKCVL